MTVDEFTIQAPMQALFRAGSDVFNFDDSTCVVEVRATGHSTLVVYTPCGRWDSNPHPFRDRDLNPARLPFRHARGDHMDKGYDQNWSLATTDRGRDR